MNTDPIDRARFPLVMERLGVWRAGWERAGPVERLQLLQRHRRRLLTATPLGRDRLRTWLNEQRKNPAAPETTVARVHRIEQSLRLHGDDIKRLVSTTLAQLPRPVSDFVLPRFMFLAVGRWSFGWVAPPLPGHTPILIDASRSDEEVSRTIRHETGHAWLHCTFEGTCPVVGAERQRIAAFDSKYAIPPELRRVLAERPELEANAFEAAYSTREPTHGKR